LKSKRFPVAVGARLEGLGALNLTSGQSGQRPTASIQLVSFAQLTGSIFVRIREGFAPIWDSFSVEQDVARRLGLGACRAVKIWSPVRR
jgi:hypothetical protein